MPCSFRECPDSKTGQNRPFPTGKTLGVILVGKRDGEIVKGLHSRALSSRGRERDSGGLAPQGWAEAKMIKIDPNRSVLDRFSLGAKNLEVGAIAPLRLDGTA